MTDPVADYIATASAAASRLEGMDGIAPRPIRRVGVIGAGTMGGGISMNFINADIPVTIVETTQEALDRGLGVVRANYERSASRGRFPMDEVDVRMARYTGALDKSALADCDLIIEAVFENMDLKKEIFAELDQIAKSGAILASNTSYLDIDEIASATSRPADVIGMHFFSPANVMKLLEVVRARETADDVVATAMGLAPKIGKIAVLAGVCHGFIGNRMLSRRQGQGQKLLMSGAMPWDVDLALNDFGFKMGPFQMADLAGLDIGWRPGQPTGNPIRDRLCELDKRGQKTGSGFYDYDAARNRTPSPVAEQVIREVSGVEPRAIDPQEVVEACLFSMINEGVKILEENKAQRASDIDVVWLNGYGWPADKGGPMWYGDQVGAAAVLEVCERLGAEDADYAPAETLRALARSGGKFTEIDTGGLKV